MREVRHVLVTLELAVGRRSREVEALLRADPGTLEVAKPRIGLLRWRVVFDSDEPMGADGADAVDQAHDRLALLSWAGWVADVRLMDAVPAQGVSRMRRELVVLGGRDADPS